MYPILLDYVVLSHWREEVILHLNVFQLRPFKKKRQENHSRVYEQMSEK